MGMATVTSKIGLAGAVSTSRCDLFAITSQFASLHLIRGGRAGWNVVTCPLEGSGRNDARPHPEHAKRHRVAGEYPQFAQGLFELDRYPPSPFAPRDGSASGCRALFGENDDLGALFALPFQKALEAASNAFRKAG